MMKRLISAGLFLLLAVAGSPVFGQEKKHDHGGHHMTPEMKKQHDTMRTIQMEWTKAEKALSKQDMKTARMSVEKMVVAGAYMLQFQLHKNSENHEQFIELTEEFRQRLNKLITSLKAGTFEDAQGHAAAVNKTCDNCHLAFR